MARRRNSQLDAAIREQVDAEAKRQMADVLFHLHYDRAVLEGTTGEGERGMYRELHREDPEACREVLARQWGATA